MNLGSSTGQAVIAFQKGTKALQFCACSTLSASVTSAPLNGATGYNVPNLANVATTQEVIVESMEFTGVLKNSIRVAIGTTASSAKTIYMGLLNTVLSGGSGCLQISYQDWGNRPRVAGGVVRLTTTAGLTYTIRGHIIDYDPSATVFE